MKASSILLTAVLVAASTTGSFAQTQSAQRVMSASQSQKVRVVTSLNFHASNSSPAPLSLDAVKLITRSTVREQVAEGLTNVTANEFASQINASFNDIANGNSITFGHAIAGTNRAATSLHSLSVKVSYEPRPIGGILNVRVALVPVFCGIGTASRPIAVREVAQAVDNFDEDTVNQIVANLSHDLASQFASN